MEPVHVSRQEGERAPVTMVLGTSKICSRSCRICSHCPAQASSTVSNMNLQLSMRTAYFLLVGCHVEEVLALLCTAYI